MTEPNPGSSPSQGGFCAPCRSVAAFVKQKLGYSPTSKRFFKELTMQSIPVFIAASFSAFISTLIEYNSEDAENKDAAECGQAFVYAFSAYVLGIIFTMVLKVKLNQENRSNSMIWLENQKLEEFLFGFFAENTAFAWKEFLTIFILKIVYLEYEIGPAFGSWLLWLSIFSLTTAVTGVILRLAKCSRGFSELITEYNADSFSFPLAFALAVILAEGLTQIGAGITNQHGYLYEWQDDEGGETDDSNSHSLSSYYYLYCLFVSMIAASILLLEENFCCQSFFEAEEEIENINPRGSIARERSDRSLQVPDENSWKLLNVEFVQFWHNFLG
jgi:hypothetical protein